MKKCPVIVKVAAYINIASGIVGVLLAIIFAILVKTTGRRMDALYNARLHPYLAGIFTAVILIFAIITIIAAVSMLRGKIWAYYFTIAAAIIAIFNRHGLRSVPAVVILMLLLVGYNNYKAFASQQDTSSTAPPSAVA